MISIAAIVAAVTAIAVALVAFVSPIVANALALAATNLIAYAIVLPIKWTIEGVHRYVHRNDK